MDDGGAFPHFVGRLLLGFLCEFIDHEEVKVVVQIVQAEVGVLGWVDAWPVQVYGEWLKRTPLAGVAVPAVVNHSQSK